MSQFIVTWVPATAINPDDQSLPVRQVYVWHLTTDHKFLVVSKDGQSWQLPGGKPDSGETLTQTAVRELHEETGISIAGQVDDLKFFGYYRVTETAADGEITYLQVRFYLQSNQPSDQLALSAEGEDTAQATPDQIQHVRSVTPAEGKNLIPWLSASGEYQLLESAHVLG